MNQKIADNQFLPEADVFTTTDDGRQILAARKGSPITKAEAAQLGLLKQEKVETPKAETTPKANKAATPAAENKSVKN